MGIASKRTTMDDLSIRGRSNITTIMSQVPKAMLEDDGSSPLPSSSDDEPIDLSIAENWLIRDEILDICRAAIEKDLSARVSFQILPDWLRRFILK